MSRFFLQKIRRQFDNLHLTLIYVLGSRILIILRRREYWLLDGIARPPAAWRVVYRLPGFVAQQQQRPTPTPLVVATLWKVSHCSWVQPRGLLLLLIVRRASQPGQAAAPRAEPNQIMRPSSSSTTTETPLVKQKESIKKEKNKNREKLHSPPLLRSSSLS